MEREHGTRAQYRRGCKCPDCRAANAAYVGDQARQARNRRVAENGLPGWARWLDYEATTHDVRALPYPRRLAMMLRRCAETVRDQNGAVLSPRALVELLYVAADELDTTAHAGHDTEKDAKPDDVGVVPATAGNGADPARL